MAVRKRKYQQIEDYRVFPEENWGDIQWGEIHTIFLKFGDLMRKPDLQREDWLELHKLCKVVFAEWMSRHENAIAGNAALLEELAENTSLTDLLKKEKQELEKKITTLQLNLAKSISLNTTLTREKRDLEYEKQDLKHDIDILDVKNKILTSDVERLKKERDCLRGKLNVADPPDTCLRVENLMTPGTIQAKIQEQEAYLRDMQDRLVTEKVIRDNIEKAKLNLSLLHYVLKAKQAALSAETCVVCLDGPKTHVLMPCCHHAFCESCAEKIVTDGTLCPCCRAAVVICYRIYQA